MYIFNIHKYEYLCSCIRIYTCIYTYIHIYMYTHIYTGHEHIEEARARS